MSAQSDLGYVTGFQRFEDKKAARAERQREIGLEDAKNKRDEEDRLRRQKREDEAMERAKILQQRADEDYERSRTEAERQAEEEGVVGLAEDLYAGMPVEMARERFNRRGKIKIEPGQMQYDAETGVVRMPDDDGTIAELPIEAVLKRYGKIKEKGPKKLATASPGSFVYDEDGKVVIRVPNRPLASDRSGGGGKGDPTGPKPLTAPQMLAYSKETRRILADTLQLKLDPATDRLIDAPSGATERWAQLGPEADRLTRKYGDRLLPAEVAAMVLEAWKDVPDEDAAIAQAAAKQPAAAWYQAGKFAGDDGEAAAAVETAAKADRKAAVARAKARLKEIEAQTDRDLGARGGDTGRPSRDDVLAQAREAITSGRRRDGVIQKLRDMGIEFDESELD